MTVELRAEKPWPLPTKEECYFYHTMTFPDGDIAPGSWTIPDFASYIGRHDLRSKTVLDVGTASGFLAFNAERAGATVTAIDVRDSAEIRQVPFNVALSYQDRAAWQAKVSSDVLIPMKNSWWYGRSKFASKIDVYYMALETLVDWDRRFDVVVAGAIVEHIADPVSAIGYWTKVAKEAVLIPFTNVVETEDLIMRPMTPWTDPSFAFAWWELSAGLYRRIFDNVGFDVEFTTTNAQYNTASGPVNGVRPSIIARRR